MESFFQNCVSEFDLNFLDQISNDNEAAQWTQNPEARKYSISRLKDRLKNVSQLINQAKSTKNKFVEAELNLSDTTKELEQIRKLLFEKNEAHRAVCDERSIYINRAKEHSNEIQNLKEKLKICKDLDFDIKLKDKIINGYSDQVKGLQNEMEKLVEERKQKDRNASHMLKQVKASKALIDRKFIRILKEYVVPGIKKRDRWLESIIRRHVPEAKNEESNELEKVDEIDENNDEACSGDKEHSKEDETSKESCTEQILNRNISVDFDYVGSVDTGRGSSLAYSDGDKSFHSPDYYMNDSPSCAISNIFTCNKCNVPKSDISTSPKSPERSEIVDKPDNNTCKRCDLLLKKDACTSPIVFQTLDTAIDTFDVSTEIINPIKDIRITSNLQENSSNTEEPHININNIHQINNTPDKKESVSYNEISLIDAVVTSNESFSYPRNLQDFTFDTDDEDIMTNSSGIASPVEELNTSSSVHYNKVVTNSQVISNKEESTAVVKSQYNIKLHSDESNENLVNASHQSNMQKLSIMSPCGITSASNNQTEKEVLSQKKKKKSLELQTVMAPDTNDNEIMHSGSPITESHMLSPNEFDDTAFKNTITASNEPPTTTTKTPDSGVNKKTQELECLALNSSNNCSNEVDFDNEITTILDKMRLRHRLITPIPATPPRGKILSTPSPVKNQNTIIGSQVQGVDDSINKQINQLRKSMQEVLAPYVKSLPRSLKETLSRLFTNSDANEKLLRNLLFNSNQNFENHSSHENSANFLSYNAHAESTSQLPSYNTHPESISQIPTYNANAGSTSQFSPYNAYAGSTCQHSPYNAYAGSISQFPSHNIHAESTSQLPAYDEHTELTNRRVPDMVNLNTGSMLCITETSKDSTFNNYSIIEEDSEPEDQPTGIDSWNTQKNTLCTVSKKLPLDVKNEIFNVSSLKVRKPEVVSLNVKVAEDNCSHKNSSVKTTHESTHTLVVCGAEYNNNTQVNVANSNMTTTSNTMESRNCIVFEGRDTLDDNNEMQNVVLANSTKQSKSSKKKLREKLRLKLLPKCKIMNYNTKSSKKLCSKPIPINSIPKKTVTESDTAASLNDKSVYENAVKVISALRSPKEPKVIVQDCVRYSLDEFKNVANNNDKNIENISSMSKSAEINTTKNNKRQMCDKLNSKSESYTSELNEAGINYTKKAKTSSISAEVTSSSSSSKTPTKIEYQKNYNRKLSENVSNLSENHTLESKEAFGISNDKKAKMSSIPVDATTSDISHKKIEHQKKFKRKLSENLSENVTLESNEISGISNTKKGITLSIPADVKTNNKSPKKIEHEQSYKRKLSQNLGNLPEDQTKSNESFKSIKKVNHSGSEPEKQNANKSPTKITQKTNDFASEIITDNEMRSPRLLPKVFQSSNPSDSKISKRKKNSVWDCSSKYSDNIMEPVSPRILRSSSYLKHDKTEIIEPPVLTQTRWRLRSKVDSNGSETHPNIYSRKNTRIARQNTCRGSESLHTEVTSTVSEISEINGRVVTYADLNMFSDEEAPTQNVDQNVFETEDNIPLLSLRKTSRIVSKKTEQNSETMQVDLHSSTVSEISKKDNATAVSYADLNVFSNEDTQEQMPADRYKKDSLLCRFLGKYRVEKLKFIAKQAPENIVNEVWKKLETRLTIITEVPHEECRSAMRELIIEIQTWNEKHFILGLMKFLKDPQRKIELFSKSFCPPSPPMTKKEQVLIYVFDELQKSGEYRNIVQRILINIEYTLFALNKPAESYEVIESMAHLYALLCRIYHKEGRLRLFIVDAMYCLQLKSVILVQQCLEVWMFALPLGHMGLAKCPLVTTIVYLLHFFKCEAKYPRVQDVRNMLRRKYNYNLSEWDENKILEVFRTAIIEIRDLSLERKTLRVALLILAKRHGAKWCHQNIVSNMLLPLIKDSSTTERAKAFCVSLLGPLLKPYPNHMKVHSEMVIDYLMDMAHKKNTPRMQEAVISSLITVDKQNIKLYQFLAKWSPKTVSREFQIKFKDYIQSKTWGSWKKILSQPIIN